MEIKYFDGDVLTSTAPIIMHQVNCQGTMRSGVAKAISEKWPIVEEKYKNFCKTLSSEELLGSTQVVKVNDNQYVANLFGQDKYGYNGKKYTSYDAIDNALKILRKKIDRIFFDTVYINIFSILPKCYQQQLYQLQLLLCLHSFS